MAHRSPTRAPLFSDSASQPKPLSIIWKDYPPQARKRFIRACAEALPRSGFKAKHIADSLVRLEDFSFTADHIPLDREQEFDNCIIKNQHRIVELARQAISPYQTSANA